MTDAVEQLEARLGGRLLQRMTRHVGSTLDAQAYHRLRLALCVQDEPAGALERSPSRRLFEACLALACMGGPGASSFSSPDQDATTQSVWK